MNDILTRIEEDFKSFSKGQKLIARFIIDHYDKAAFMKASKLGEAVSMSESTVVRFATELGYEGYPELQKALQEMVKNKLTAVQRMEIESSRLEKKDVLKTVLNSDVEKIRSTLEGLDKDVFDKVVDAILNARRIYILGVRSSASIAGFLGFYFNLLFDDVRLIHTTSTNEIFEQILKINKDDVAIGISFPRYSRQTVKAMEYAKDKGVKVIALTDTHLSPLSHIADYTLYAKSDMASFVDSLVAPLSVINALIVAIGMKKQDEISKTFEDLENIWDEYQVYEKLDER